MSAQVIPIIKWKNETLHSKLWPNISAKIWRAGRVWFCKCEANGYPELAKIDNFTSRQAAIDHAKLGLGLR